MMMTNGVGAYLGSKVSGVVIDAFFVHDGVNDWKGIWLTFAAYSAVIAVLFLLMFRHKHIVTDAEAHAHG